MDILVNIIKFYLIYAFLSTFIHYLTPKKITPENKVKLDNKEYINNKLGPDKALLIEDGFEAFNIRIELLRNAKISVDIVYHLVKISSAINFYFKEVLDAANRGVKIRIILDRKSGLFDKKVKDILRLLNNHDNITIYSYNPINLLKPWKIQALMHDKYMVVDNKYLILGGRNLYNRFFGESKKKNYLAHDRDVFICKLKESKISVINQINEYTNLLLSQTKKIKDYLPLNEKKLKLSFEDAYLYEEKSSYMFKNKLDGFLNKMVDTNKITLIHNPVNSGQKESWLFYELSKLVNLGKKRIVIQTPYATGSKVFLKTLTRIGQNTNAIFITNSIKSTPNIIAFSNYLSHRKEFIKTNFRIYEYVGDNSIHGKSILIDDNISIVGTFNMDARSLNIDTETMLVINSKDFNSHLNKELNNIVKKSMDISKKRNLNIPIIRAMHFKIVGLISRLIEFLI